MHRHGMARLAPMLAAVLITAACDRPSNPPRPVSAEPQAAGPTRLQAYENLPPAVAAREPAPSASAASAAASAVDIATVAQAAAALRDAE